jgi:hypothetical protein
MPQQQARTRGRKHEQLHVWRCHCQFELPSRINIGFKSRSSLVRQPRPILGSRCNTDRQTSRNSSSLALLWMSAHLELEVAQAHSA